MNFNVQYVTYYMLHIICIRKMCFQRIPNTRGRYLLKSEVRISMQLSLFLLNIRFFPADSYLAEYEISKLPLSLL